MKVELKLGDKTTLSADISGEYDEKYKFVYCQDLPFPDGDFLMGEIYCDPIGMCCRFISESGSVNPERYEDVKNDILFMVESNFKYDVWHTYF